MAKRNLTARQVRYLWAVGAFRRKGGTKRGVDYDAGKAAAARRNSAGAGKFASAGLSALRRNNAARNRHNHHTNAVNRGGPTLANAALGMKAAHLRSGAGSGRKVPSKAERDATRVSRLQAAQKQYEQFAQSRKYANLSAPAVASELAKNGHAVHKRKNGRVTEGVQVRKIGSATYLTASTPGQAQAAASTLRRRGYEVVPLGAGTGNYRVRKTSEQVLPQRQARRERQNARADAENAARSADFKSKLERSNRVRTARQQGQEFVQRGPNLGAQLVRDHGAAGFKSAMRKERVQRVAFGERDPSRVSVLQDAAASLKRHNVKPGGSLRLQIVPGHPADMRRAKRLADKLKPRR